MSSCDHRPLLNCYEQEEPALVELVRGTIIPPDHSQPYNLSETGDIHSFYESRKSVPDDLSLDMEQTYLKDVKNGFFIEAGASQGNFDTVDKTQCDPSLWQGRGTPTLCCSRRATTGRVSWWSPWSTGCSSNTAR